LALKLYRQVTRAVRSFGRRVGPNASVAGAKKPIRE
jgi:hypothetical protein